MMVNWFCREMCSVRTCIAKSITNECIVFNKLYNKCLSKQYLTGKPENCARLSFASIFVKLSAAIHRKSKLILSKNLGIP